MDKGEMDGRKPFADEGQRYEERGVNIKER